MHSIDGWPVMTLNDVECVVVRQFEVQYDLDGMTWRCVPPTMEPVNQCEHCHRFDMREVVARSHDDLVTFGWVVPLAVYRQRSAAD